MSLLQRYRYLCAVLAVFVCASAWAGNPNVLILGTSASFSSTGVGSPTTQTITLTFSDNGNQADGASLGALAFGGGNASDFAIVGGTCDPGTTVLSDGNTSCTVVVRYTPSSSANETAELDGTCTTVGLVGGFTLSCNGTSAEVVSLFGAVLAALIQLPMLDPKMLTLLFSVLLAVGVYFANRKRA
jgi:hypothetical protein